MAELSHIELDGETLEISDETARENIDTHEATTGNVSTAGHVKLSSSTSNSSDVSGGTAATPLAVKNAYDKAEEAYSKAETAIDNADEASAKADTATSIAKGRNQSLSYLTYSDMVTALNVMASGAMGKGQNLYIGTVGVPDLWVYGIEDTAVTYSYTDDDTFVNELTTNTTVQIGYYKVAQLEGQKVDLTDINAEIATNATNIATNAENIAKLSNFLTGTLTAGETSLTISDSSITEDSIIDIYTNVYGVNPTEVTVESGSITLEFDAQETDLGVKVKVM